MRLGARAAAPGEQGLSLAALSFNAQLFRSWIFFIHSSLQVALGSITVYYEA